MINAIEKWVQEIQIAERFREDEFGKYDKKEKSLAGFNIDYFEKGYGSQGSNSEIEVIQGWIVTTVNIVHALTKIVIPSILFQNPRVLTYPRKVDSQETAPIVAEILNHFYKQVDAEEVNQKVVWDAFVLGYGVSKIGYATKYGMDIEDEKKKKKSPVDRVLESLKLKKPIVEEETHPEVNYKIVSEKPYISYVSPFNFGIDPRATSLDNAMYVYEKFKKTLSELKRNKKYKNTKDLHGSDPDLPTSSTQPLSESQMDDFKTVDLYEIHYRTEDGIYILVISDDNNNWKEHYHEKSNYELDGWQYEFLSFNKHGHRLYPLSEISKMKGLQERINSTIDSILEIVDRFSPKLAVNETDISPDGKKALRDGDIGAIVWTTKDPNAVIKELMFTQLKTDLQNLVAEFINLISIQTGITRAQLTGQIQANTATEVSVEQGGQTLRLNDMARQVNRYLKNQAGKLWQVIKQFVELEELQMINGVSGIDPKTGNVLYSWLTVDDIRGESMRVGEYDFDIEVGSTQKPDLSIVRKQFENFFSILARTDVITMIQQQGKKVDLGELVKMYLQLYPEMLKDIGKIIQPITQQTTGLIPPEVEQRGGTTAGSNFNAVEAMSAEGVPNGRGIV